MKVVHELSGAAIAGTGHAVPERVLTNFDLEKMVDTSDEWIRTRTGIRERRVADENTATSDLAVAAAHEALDMAGMAPSDLDLIVVATVTPDMLFPSTACLVQDRLGAAHAAAFDLSAGCSGFVYALATAAQFIQTGAYSNALVVGAETLSKITDWQDRSTCVLFGDGAGAVVLKAAPAGKGLLSFVLGADGSGKDKLRLPAGGSRLPASAETVAQRQHYIQMCGHDVFRFAVRVLGEATREALDKAGLGLNQLDFFVPHQANVRIIDAAVERLELPKEKVIVNVDRFGNTSAASVAIALDEAVRSGRIQPGQVVAMTGFGAGLTWASAVFRW